MNEKRASFRNLTVWQKAQDLALLVNQTVSRLPRSRSADSIAYQIARSSGSVPANIAEGYGRFSDGAFRNHLSIARGSLFETESWVDLLFKSGCLSPQENDLLVSRCEEVGRLLTSRMNQLAQPTRYAVREEGVLYGGAENGLE